MVLPLSTRDLVAFYPLGSESTLGTGSVLDTWSTNDATPFGYGSPNNVVMYAIPLAALYALDGNGSDSSELLKHLTETAMTWGPGKLGSAAYFNGSNSLLRRTAFNPPSSSQTHSLFAWVYVNNLGSVRTVSSFDGTSTFDILTDGRLRVEIQGSTNSGRIFSVGSVPINTWTHVGYEFYGHGATNQGRDIDEVDIFINGSVQSKTFSSIAASTSSSTNFNIGAYTAGVNTMLGSIDDVRVYKFLLNNDEVGSIYNNGSGWTGDFTYTYVRNGPFGSSLRFYGQDHYFQLATSSTPANLSTDSSSPFSISMWAKIPSFNNLQANAAVGIVGRLRDAHAIHFQYNGSQSVSINWGVREGAATSIKNFAVATDIWNHIVGVYDHTGSKVHLYINGSYTGSSNVTFAFTPSQNLFLGGGLNNVVSGNASGFTGEISDLYFYNRILPQDDVTKLYNNNVPGSGLVVKYLFEESLGSGSSIIDTHYTVNGPNNNYRKAWAFKGTEDIDISDSANLDFTKCSILLNVRPENNDCDIMRKWVSTGNQRSWSINLNSTNNFFFTVSNSGSSADTASVSSSTTAALGSYYRLGCVYDGSYLRLYVNGSLEDSTLSGSIFKSTSPIEIADSFVRTNNFIGAMNNIVMYNYALGEDAILSEYSSGSGTLLGSYAISGSWISNLITYTPYSEIRFIGSATTGSSLIQYNIINSVGSLVGSDYTASNGSNSLNVTSLVSGNYRTVFYLSGSSAKVSDFKTYTSGSQIQFLNLGSDIKLSSSKFNRLSYIPNGSYVNLLQGSFTTNGGTSWFGANPNEEIFINSSNSGSQILFKAFDSTGSVVIDSIFFIIKQDDF